MNAEMIKAADAGTIKYRWFMDDQQDQRYDLRTVGTSMINNEEVYTILPYTAASRICITRAYSVALSQLMVY